MVRDDHDLEVVDFLELDASVSAVPVMPASFSKTRKWFWNAIEASVWFSFWILAPLLRLERLVHAVRPARARHQPAGELVDDDHLVVLDDVVPVAEEQVVRPQRLVEVMVEVDVRRLVQARPLGQHPRTREEHLRVLVARLGEEHGVVLPST